MTADELTEKAKKYCAYSERCSFDLIQKLNRLGTDKTTSQTIIKQLIQEGYVDDERFSIIFAKSKLKNNSWGKIKIRYELLKRRIDQSIIETALEEIDEKAYLGQLKTLFKNKSGELQNKNKDHIKEKAVAYCLQKGFETDLVLAVKSEK